MSDRKHMLKLGTLLVVVALLALIALPAAAQNVDEGNAGDVALVPVSIPAAGAPFLEIPAEMRLSGLRPVYQQFNRCSSAALTIQMSYFGWGGSYDEAIRGLNPHSEDVAVRLEEMADFARANGLRAHWGIGGTLDLLRQLVAAEIPVLIEQGYYDSNDINDWMSHNRVVMGYNDAAQEFYVFDPLLGNGPDGTGRPMTYEFVAERWRPFANDYLVLYEPEDEFMVQQILGQHLDPIFGAENAIRQAQAEIDNGSSDSFTYFNLGTAYNVLGRYENAAEAFDRARSTGLPWRMMWYQYGPLEAYLEVGRYDDVITLARSVISSEVGVEEMYYYAGLAYEAQGQFDRARANFQVAVQRNAFFSAAQTALRRVGG
ncbi:MAG: tetratricopeptide repeat protein [Chloroflexi bacterium]|nr:tetratricopeptide repeat protein [Chloroflexota bacterium]